jgi:hypothetical protein
VARPGASWNVKINPYALICFRISANEDAPIVAAALDVKVRYAAKRDIQIRIWKRNCPLRRSYELGVLPGLEKLSTKSS